MRVSILGFVIVALQLVAAVPAAARPDRRPCDDATLATAQAAVVAVCPCSTAANHGQYVSCAVHVMNDGFQNGTIPRECRRPLRRGAARSSCGKPGFVTCCRTHGLVTGLCSVRRSAEVCTAAGGCVGATMSCLDACAHPCGSPSGAFVETPSGALF